MYVICVFVQCVIIKKIINEKKKESITPERQVTTKHQDITLIKKILLKFIDDKTVLINSV